MTPQEREAAKIVGRILRSARKQRALTQTDVSRALGISQAALSKYESGSLMLSAHHWSEFCRLTEITMESLRAGFIDHGRRLELRSDRYEGTFRLPKAFAENRGTSVRVLAPLLKHMYARLGNARFHEFLEQQEIDSDFFVTLDHSIGIEFMYVLARTLMRQGDLKTKDLATIVKPAADPQTHGALAKRYEGLSQPERLLGALIENAPYYSLNFKFRIEDLGRSGLEVSAAPGAHLDRARHLGDPELGDFLCRYRKAFYERFSGLQIVDEPECSFKGAHRCVYRLRPASG